MNANRTERRRGSNSSVVLAQRRFFANDTNIFLLFVAALSFVCFCVGSLEQPVSTINRSLRTDDGLSRDDSIYVDQQEEEDLEHDNFYFFHGRPAWEEFTWEGRLAAFQRDIKRAFIRLRRIFGINETSILSYKNETVPRTPRSEALLEVQMLLRQEEGAGFLRANSKRRSRIEENLDRINLEELYRIPN